MPELNFWIRFQLGKVKKRSKKKPDVVCRRLDVLETKWKQKKAWCGGLLKTDVLIDLWAEFPTLVDHSSPDSEELISSQSSAGSAKSSRQLAIPVPPKQEKNDVF